MISHIHKCIFIHITKCAGSSVEHAFGVNVHKNTPTDYEHLFGWCPQNKLFLQHATPQQLLDLGYISPEVWAAYYKFIIVRNPWSRAYSDYYWLIENSKIYGSFEEYINGEGGFKEIMHKTTKRFRGDHLYPQIDYFFMHGKGINYDQIVYFENLNTGLDLVTQQLVLPRDFFTHRVNTSSKKLAHYSLFYNNKRKRLVEEKFKKDISFLKYQFEERKTVMDKIKLPFRYQFPPTYKSKFKYKYPKLAAFYKGFSGILGWRV
ncbi:sulfotransferase family 2 domain-containing protein [Aequorivita vladivostokensis]|uniref:sulfotransferase family 2 domain-containing protein n=1 Tax=Aequorivita vladivostokensis TaxID=171194 RepID=UPI0009FCBE3A|nr:sulfotransferase family 2 domain-containing protein [Aequorivita vladivostokensis]